MRPIHENAEIGCTDARPIHENAEIGCGNSRSMDKIKITPHAEVDSTLGGPSSQTKVENAMSDIPIEFLVGPRPQSLPDSIRQVSNASAGFCRSWLQSEFDDAEATSEEAFGLLDHIQNELLRHRDTQSKHSTWNASPLKAALSVVIGRLITPATPSDKTAFEAQALGSGSLPAGSATIDLTLSAALNKLKHRSTNVVNFAVSQPGTHVLFVFTLGGMGQPDTICSFDVQEFCKACKNAAQLV